MGGPLGVENLDAGILGIAGLARRGDAHDMVAPAGPSRVAGAIRDSNAERARGAPSRQGEGVAGYVGGDIVSEAVERRGERGGGAATLERLGRSQNLRE